MRQSAFEILGLKERYTKEDVKKKYLELIRKYSPESNPKEFMKIREAYDKINKPSTEKEFVIYKTPLEIFETQESEHKNEKLTKKVLTEIFEVPFDTVGELKQLLQKQEFNK